MAIAKAFDGLPPHGGLRRDVYHPVGVSRREPVAVNRYSAALDTALQLAERDSDVTGITRDMERPGFRSHVALRWGRGDDRLRAIGEAMPTRWQAVLDAYLRLRILRLDTDDPDHVPPHPDSPSGRRLGKVAGTLTRPDLRKGVDSPEALEAVAAWVDGRRSGLLESLAHMVAPSALAPGDVLAMARILGPVSTMSEGMAAFCATLDALIAGRRIAASLRSAAAPLDDGRDAA